MPDLRDAEAVHWVLGVHEEDEGFFANRREMQLDAQFLGFCLMRFGGRRDEDDVHLSGEQPLVGLAGFAQVHIVRIVFARFERVGGLGEGGIDGVKRGRAVQLRVGRLQGERGGGVKFGEFVVGVLRVVLPLADFGGDADAAQVFAVKLVAKRIQHGDARAGQDGEPCQARFAAKQRVFVTAYP